MQTRYYKQHSTCKTISRMPWISGWFWTGKSLICKPTNEYKIGIVRTFISYAIIPNVNRYECSILCDLELEFKSWYFKIFSRTLAREYRFKVTSLLLLLRESYFTIPLPVVMQLSTQCYEWTASSTYSSSFAFSTSFHTNNWNSFSFTLWLHHHTINAHQFARFDVNHILLGFFYSHYVDMLI